MTSTFRRAIQTRSLSAGIARGIRGAIVTAVPFAIAFATGNVSVAPVIVMGAITIVFLDPGPPNRQRLIDQIGIIVVASIVIIVGSFVAHWVWASALVMFVVAFVAGLSSIWGRNVKLMFFFASIFMLIWVDTPLDIQAALRMVLLTILGMVFAMLVVYATWPFHREGTVQFDLAKGYRAIGPFLNAAITDHKTELPAARAAVEQALAATEKDLDSHLRRAHSPSPVDDRLILLAGGLRRLYYDVITIAEASDAGVSDPAGARSAAKNTVQLAKAELADIASQITHGKTAETTTSSSGDVPGEPGSLSTLRDASTNSDEIGYLQAVIDFMTDLRSVQWPTTSSEVQPRFGWPGAPQDGLSTLTRARRMLQANLNFDSFAFRHALRYAVLAAATIPIYRYFDIPNGYWLTLTVALVLDTEASATFVKSLQRMGGTIIGAVLAIILTTYVRDEVMQVAVMTVLMGLTVAFFSFNYGSYVIWLTSSVVVMLGLGKSPAYTTLDIRTVMTLEGGLIVLAGAYFLWPGWNRIPIRQALLKISITSRNLVSTELRLLANPATDIPLSRTRSAHDETRLALSNGALALQRLAGAPKSKRRGLLEPAGQFVAHARQAADISAILDVRARSRPFEAGQVEDLASLTQEIADTMDQTSILLQQERRSVHVDSPDQTALRADLARAQVIFAPAGSTADPHSASLPTDLETLTTDTIAMNGAAAQIAIQAR